MAQNKDIDNGNPFDWGRTALIYARYRDIYPEEFYEKVVALGLAGPGMYVLDLGTGTGVLPRNLYKTGTRFVAVDSSMEQIVQARGLSRDAAGSILYLSMPAEDIEFDPDSFDAAMACQSYWYFDEARLWPKMRQMIKPGGLFGIMTLGWLPDESEIAAKSEKIVLKYNPHWTGHSWQRGPIEPPAAALQHGFEVANSTGFDVQLPFTRESWNGRMVACRGVGASLSSDARLQFEAQHLNMLRQTTPEEFTIPHWAAMLTLRNTKQA